MERFGSRNLRDAITSRFRLRDYDYSTPGLYFVTVCLQDRKHLFGHVVDGRMCLNDIGRMASDRWRDLSATFSDVTVEHGVVMPNHVHAIVAIGLDTPDAAERTSLPDVMHWYKSISTNMYIKGVKTLGWPRFNGRLWQPGYHERIVRNERELNIFWKYIENNPANWNRDTFYE